MILEGIVTTRNDDGTVNVAPMGPLVDESLQTLILRPFRSSTTYANLKRTGEGVLHVTDDVLLIARAAIDQLDKPPETFPAIEVDGAVLQDACRWFEFRVTSLDDVTDRTCIEAEVIHTGHLREFFGFNRAKHAVIEGAILATRLHLLPRGDVQAELDRLAVLVEKTAGPNERQAFQLLQEFVDAWEE